ncbi:MAG: NAD-dependent epimerase/dehydratase family protein [Alistipes sp.]|nr:NAD-dependent epimerase/dehydratase family protein [Alistipes sp.]
MNRIYLVTGATGFLGGEVCRQLIRRGEKVRALALVGDKAIGYLPEGVEVVQGDLCDRDTLRQFFSVSEDMQIVVLHIASIVTVDPTYNERVMEVNVNGTRKIIDMCWSHPNFYKLVYCGSTGSIPEDPKGVAIKEVEMYYPSLVRGCYSQSKAKASQEVMNAAKQGLNACIVHPSGIMGPEDFAVGETTKTLVEIIKGRMPMGIAGSFNLADVRDLAAGVIAAADKGVVGESYILANEEVSFKEFARLVCQESGCKPIRGFVPCSVAMFLAKIMERVARWRGKKPLMTTFSVYNLSRNNCYDYSKAVQELGYKTRSYKDTIRDEITWLKTAGKI